MTISSNMKKENKVEDWFSLKCESSKNISENLSSFRNKNDFEKVLNHIKNLIFSSKLLLDQNFLNQSVFITITAIEEMSKAEMCIYRDNNISEFVKKSKDPLFNHRKKHLVAADYTLEIHNKLYNHIGKKRADELFLKLRNGEFADIRNNCLYFENTKSNLILPNEIVDISFAKEVFMLSVVIFEEKFSYLTNISSSITVELQELVEEIL